MWASQAGHSPSWHVPELGASYVRLAAVPLVGARFGAGNRPGRETMGISLVSCTYH